MQITIDRDVYDRLQKLVAPPVNDVNSAIRALMDYDGRSSPSVVALGAAEQHFSMDQELERARMGVYDSGGAA
jgi:hypothetical protein